jgi:hypothetical protein
MKYLFMVPVREVRHTANLLEQYHITTTQPKKKKKKKKKVVNAVKRVRTYVSRASTLFHRDENAIRCISSAFFGTSEDEFFHLPFTNLSGNNKPSNKVHHFNEMSSFSSVSTPERGETSANVLLPSSETESSQQSPHSGSRMMIRRPKGDAILE